jgi:hypothetical protein
MMIENEKRAEQAAKRRQDEWEAREAKIKQAVGRMADTVLKRNNE